MKLESKTAIVTGASQGIGNAIAKELVEQGAELYMVGRSVARLKKAARAFRTPAKAPTFLECDLSRKENVSVVVSEFSATNDSLDILVNCGGAYERSSWSAGSSDLLKHILDTNVRGPYLLTQTLLPYLIKARGDIIFINSSIVRGSGARTGHYAAGQHALRSLADSLRAEVNDLGVRVSSIFPGRTATPRQEAIYKNDGRDYRPEELLQPEDVAAAALACLTMPHTAEITDLHIRQRHDV